MAAAKILSQHVTFSAISLSKTKKILGRQIDVSKGPGEVEEVHELGSLSAMNTSKEGSQHHRHNSSATLYEIERKLLLDQAATFRDFEHLFLALNALEEWSRLSIEAKEYVRMSPALQGNVTYTDFE